MNENSQSEPPKPIIDPGISSSALSIETPEDYPKLSLLIKSPIIATGLLIMAVSAVLYTIDDSNFVISVLGLGIGLVVASVDVIVKPKSLQYKMQAFALFAGIAFVMAMTAFLIGFVLFFDF